MDKVSELLQNPAIKAGIKLSSPEIALGLDILMAIIKKRPPSVNDLLKIIDKRLANILIELDKPQPRFYKRELEIRALQLLELVVDWEKIR